MIFTSAVTSKLDHLSRLVFSPNRQQKQRCNMGRYKTIQKKKKIKITSLIQKVFKGFSLWDSLYQCSCWFFFSPLKKKISKSLPYPLMVGQTLFFNRIHSRLLSHSKKLFYNSSSEKDDLLCSKHSSTHFAYLKAFNPQRTPYSFLFKSIQFPSSLVRGHTEFID